MNNPAFKLFEAGTSVWYDNISRELLDNGELKRFISEWGVRGLTSNPTIFDKAISSSSIYDDTILRFKGRGVSTNSVFEELAVEDISRAADVLRPIFEESRGQDGYVSIEVSPLLASDTKGTVTEAKRLYERLNRPNIMIKVPATAEGIPAVYALLEEGINVNITLLFSVDNYCKVAETYIAALESRRSRNLPVDGIASVASFFVSRVDTIIDKQLDRIVSEESDAQRVNKAKMLRGKFGVANSKIAYKNFQELFNSERFAMLSAAGAMVQRPLWASTSTKDPSYRDVIYVEELIGPNTVNTIPHSTLEAFLDHGKVRQTLTQDIDAAFHVEKSLGDLGIDVKQLLEELQIDGVKKFSDSFQSLNDAIAKKL